jgi:hypothetical protein
MPCAPAASTIDRVRTKSAAGAYGSPWRYVAVAQAEQAAMVVHLSRAPLVEPLADPLGPLRVAREQHERRVVAQLCAKVDLWHAPVA